MNDCAQLFYLDSAAWRPLPAWAEFFIDAGADVYGTLDLEQRLVAAITVPTRAYAAALLALGIVVNSIGSGGGTAHINRLKELAIDTPLFVFKKQPSGMCRAKGLYKGWCLERISGEEIPYITVQFNRAGDARHGYPLTMWPSIQVAAFPVESMPKRETWHQIAVDAPFISRTVGHRGAKDLAMRSQLECVILGQASTLYREFVDTPVAVQARDNTFVEGRLQDIVRARRFTSALAAFRSDVIAVDSPDLDSAAGNPPPAIAILDGSAAYLKWRHLFRSSDRIIVLDRADRTFEEAVRTLNDEYALERTDDLDLDLGAAPPGVDVMAFWETVA